MGPKHMTELLEAIAKAMLFCLFILFVCAVNAIPLVIAAVIIATILKSC